MNNTEFRLKNIFLSVIAHFGGAREKHKYGVFLFENRLFERALVWYKKSAELGYVVAIHDLANMYDLGCGTPRDINLAIELYNKAASSGEAMSMWGLATTYMPNYKPEHDIYLSYLWILRTIKFCPETKPAMKELASQYKPKIREYMVEKVGEEKVIECEAEANNWNLIHNNALHLTNRK